MSITAIDPLAGSGARPLAAAVVRGEAYIRHRVARLLGEAGFALHGEPAAGMFLVAGVETRDDTRLRDVRALAQVDPDAPLLALVPNGTSNASLRRILLAGATGILFEDAVDEAIVPTALAMLAGQLVLPMSLGRQIAPRPLSHREKQTLGLVMLGMTNREIAGKLFLAESTVKTHLSSAFRKIDARSRSEAAARIEDPETNYREGILAAVSDLRP